MNIAEQLEARGREDVAVNLLKEGTDLRFVAKVSNLPLELVIKLKESLGDEGPNTD